MNYMPQSKAKKTSRYNLKSPGVIIKVLASTFHYTVKKFPGKSFVFLMSKTLEFIFQIITVGLFALTVQLKFSETSSGESAPFQQVVSHPTLDYFINMPLMYILTLLTAFIMFSVLFSFICRRILTRIAVDVEYHMSADILKSAQSIQYSQFSLLNQIFPNFQKTTILRLVQQNTRLVGIVARNLISALFSVLQLLTLFILFWFLGYKIVPFLLLLTFAVAGMCLIWLFRIGIAHSVNFPASSAAAGKVRSQMLSRILYMGYPYDENIERDYYGNEKIKTAIKDYEDRFKIIDIGSFIINLITSITLIIIILSFFGGGVVISTTLLIAVVFIGNIVLRSVQQLSSFFVIIGRLYSQIWEAWAYRSVLELKISENADTVGKAIAADSFIVFTDSLTGKPYTVEPGKVVTICQHEEIGKMALFRIIQTASETSDINSGVLKNLTVAARDSLDNILQPLSSEEKESLRKSYDTALAQLPEGEEFENEAAFAIYAYVKLSEGIILIPLDELKHLNAKLAEILFNGGSENLLILYGRSPDRRLREYVDIIDRVILLGNSCRILPTSDALKLTGVELRTILTTTTPDVSPDQDETLGSVDELT